MTDGDVVCRVREAQRELEARAGNLERRIGDNRQLNRGLGFVEKGGSKLLGRVNPLAGRIFGKVVGVARGAVQLEIENQEQELAKLQEQIDEQAAFARFQHLSQFSPATPELQRERDELERRFVDRFFNRDLPDAIDRMRGDIDRRDPRDIYDHVGPGNGPRTSRVG